MCLVHLPEGSVGQPRNAECTQPDNLSVVACLTLCCLHTGCSVVCRPSICDHLDLGAVIVRSDRGIVVGPLTQGAMHILGLLLLTARIAP